MQNHAFVILVHLLQKDEGDDRVWSKTSVVGSETLPQTEEAFVSYCFAQDILESRKRKTLFGLQPYIEI